MEQTRKREGDELNDVDDSSVKRPRPTEEPGGGDLGDDIMAWLSMEDDTVTVGDLVNFLDTKPLTRVKFIENPYTSPLMFQSYSSYVTINGNEETCGSSFSDSESSLMVSVDIRGIINVAVGTRGSNGVVGEEEGGGFLKGDEMDGSDLDDYVLARFMGEEVL
ncbi:uncharacterized protein LOC116119272 [Pistacia vera]|uniref:uncharacterized protein LOC116119272 n=1 Tax=Pistacia vera TaxID=55513 RepID=UPI001262DEF6|nr:uncharacterized protein LOC116119272 [Pistacia vera]